MSTPGAGHVRPLLPLAGAFVSGGDEVLLVSGPEVEPLAAEARLPFAVAGRSQDEWMARLGRFTRGIPGDGLDQDRILHYFLPRGFAEVGVDEMIDDVVRHGRAFAPDVVIFEAFALAGPLAADILGVPAVAHMFGPLPPAEAVQLANDAVARIWCSFGREVPGWAGMYRELTIEICPAMLETAAVPTGQTLCLRPVPLPSGPRIRAPQPTVYVTFGTLFNSDLGLFRIALDALAEMPVHLVMTVGPDQDPSELGALPANVRVERFIAQADLLPSCSVVVHHGGAGTTFGALAHGVPQVILPQGADNYEHAAMCEGAGVGLTLNPDVLNNSSLASAVQQVLRDPTFAAASDRCAEQIAKMPDAVTTSVALRAWVSARKAKEATPYG